MCVNNVCKEIFKAIHEGKWVSIEYKNQDDKVTRYWIGIKNINIERMQNLIDGLEYLINETWRESSKSTINNTNAEDDGIQKSQSVEKDIKKVFEVNLTKYIFNISSLAMQSYSSMAYETYKNDFSPSKELVNLTEILSRKKK